MATLDIAKEILPSAAEMRRLRAVRKFSNRYFGGTEVRTMTRSVWILVCWGVLALSTGCATSTLQNQIVPTAHGTLVIPGDFMGTSSSSTEKAQALEEAAGYCRTRGQQVEIVLTSENGNGFLEIAAPLIEFRCVASAGG
jgi:hypothetical protein